MISNSASSGDRLDELLFAWHQESGKRGRESSAEELCHDCPELAPELARRLRAVKRVEALIVSCEETSGRSSDGAGVSDTVPPIVPAGYELLGEVGRGGMGVVYKARHVALNRIEAVKTVKAGMFASPDSLARFRFEAEAAAGLDHPNIVTVYGVGESVGGPYLAMRWVEGESLEDCRPKSPYEIAAFLAKVARAVHYAHQRGILHRDLKPRNILVDAAGEPYVADFGIARRLGADATVTHSGGLIGTPAYMSPEQARGEPNLTVASDVYSLGVILYELLTGRLPFSGSVPEILQKVLSDEAPPEPHRVSAAAEPDLGAVCMKCLEKQPGDRYATAGELADELDCFLRGEGVRARPPGLWDWLKHLWRTWPDSAPYAWQVLTWFSGIVLASHVAVFCLAAAGGSVVWVWFALLAQGVAQGAVLWYYELRQFRSRIAGERHSTVIAVAHIVAQTMLMFALVPLAFEPRADTALHYYPPLAAVSGLGLFVLGSTHWGRFLPIGVAVLFLVPVLAWQRELAPLLYGVVIGAVMFYWGWALKVTFHNRQADRNIPDSCQVRERPSA